MSKPSLRDMRAFVLYEECENSLLYNRKKEYYKNALKLRDDELAELYESQVEKVKVMISTWVYALPTEELRKLYEFWKEVDETGE